MRPAALLLARGRFVLLTGGLLAVVAAGPWLRNVWDKLTRTPPAGGAVSPGTEYWCPMCPGVVSDWPAKCPVCSMALVRRDKGDMTPLPDGAVARVQLSPYRLQLAGVRTAPVEFRRLETEAVVAGFLDGGASSLSVAADVWERDAAGLTVGAEAAVTCDAHPGEPVAGRVTEITPAAVPAAGRRVRVRVENPRGDLRPGVYAAAVVRTPVAREDWHRRAEGDRRRDRLAVAALLGDTPAALPDAAVREAAARAGLALAVPEPAVIDTGTRRVVFVEAMPGVFDAVEVRLGRRCGDFYPVLDGVDLGQRVATAGAALLDAETRLNPALAAAYFGSGPRPTATTPTLPPAATSDDRSLIARQKLCPVTDGDLDAMGGAVKLTIDGRTLFVCCAACEKPLRRSPGQYLAKLPK
jgi:hypothetical protein